MKVSNNAAGLPVCKKTEGGGRDYPEIFSEYNQKRFFSIGERLRLAWKKACLISDKIDAWHDECLLHMALTWIGVLGGLYIVWGVVMGIFFS